jgi:hypothetical protein
MTPNEIVESKLPLMVSFWKRKACAGVPTRPAASAAIATVTACAAAVGRSAARFAVAGRALAAPAFFFVITPFSPFFVLLPVAPAALSSA